ncbi:MAG: DNA replication/repair protein RecF [Rhodospirillaceae bacterium]
MPAVLRLTLTRFRNYRSARLETGPEPVVLTGSNGAGKTNLLEALSFLSPGRGLRRARLDEVELTAHDAPPEGWAVAAGLSNGVEIGTGSVPGGGRERRQVRIDGHTAKGQTALADHLSVLWLTPQMDRLFLEGSSGRRRFLDRLAFGFDPAHAGRLSRYEHAMRERARLLREGRRDSGWLAALEDQMATGGVAVAAARREVAARLSAACAAGIGPFPRAELAVAGLLEDRLADRPALPVEDEFRHRLRDSRRLDAETGATTLGPHRSDFQVRWRKADGPPLAAESCSTGEQKALLLAIVLANARLLAERPAGPPLLLLDEVAAHLDEARRAALFDEILALGGQAWLTGTDDALFVPLKDRARFISVADGRVF